jgi:uncharacterized Zn-binding protein involved in type VI secretion
MRPPIRKGDLLEHGGEVTTASPYTTFMGRALARQGDEAVCVLHGKTTIGEGNPSFIDRDGKSFAMHQHCCACGCRVMASLTNVHIAS